MNEAPYLLHNLEYLKCDDKKVKNVFHRVHLTYITIDGKYIYAIMDKPSMTLDIWEIYLYQ
ncbi:hypothetical protein LCGC14_0856240 [marine sediment metagenome]|uniref:Uncharacterized protein n=1 Tax=marine sediment metagenome TaxID=412755 RepID=A0A0F9SFU6_9ZZZZ